MRERVVVKWGGGLITKKNEMKSVRVDVLDDLARQLEACLEQGVDVVLVHGVQDRSVISKPKPTDWQKEKSTTAIFQAR